LSNNHRHPLRLNVGFLLHQGVGTSRSFDFEHRRVQVGSDLQVASLKGSVRLSRTAQGLYAQGEMTAETQSECVRCLTEIPLTLKVHIDDLFVYPPNQGTDPILTIPETGVLDLAPLLREYLLLEIPLQPLCQPGCKGLCPECGNNLNENTC
jgi:uncharacterized protein